MVINGSCSTNMCARQLSFNFSSMVWGGMAPWPPFGSAPETTLMDKHYKQLVDRQSLVKNYHGNKKSKI